MGQTQMTASERKQRMEKAAEGASANMNEEHETSAANFQIVARQDEEKHEEGDEGEEEHGDGSNSLGEMGDDTKDDSETDVDDETDNDPEGEGKAEEDVNEKGGPRISDVIREFYTHVAFMIWVGQKASEWRIPNNATRFKAIIDSSGLFPIVSTCYKSVNKSLISAFVERWYPETNTFHLPFGEMTVTIDDASLLRILVEGKPVQSMSYEMEQAVSIVSM